MELAYRGEKRRWNADAPSEAKPQAHLGSAPSSITILDGPRIEDCRLGCWTSGLWPVLGKPCIPIAGVWGYGAGDATPARSLTELDKPEAPNWAGRAPGNRG